MPQAGFHSAFPPLTAAQAQLARRLRQHVRHLTETIGPRNLYFYQALQQSVDWLEHQLQELNYTVQCLPYQVKDQTFVNLHTQNDVGPITLVGAHYDSVYQCPGANDNASAVAALLELARLLQGRKHLRFVLFTNEEPPFFATQDMGSRKYLQNMLREGTVINNMICLETLGYYTQALASQKSPWPDIFPGVGNFVAICGDVQSTALVAQMLRRWQNLLEFPCMGIAPLPESEQALMQAGLDQSDHQAFWQAGIPAVMITDTVFYRYAHYHTLQDTWDKLTYEPMAQVVEGLAAVLSQPLL